jgi:hypothetical protein
VSQVAGHFDNSASHISHAVVDEMARLRCRRAPYPAWFPDLAIGDFFLLGCTKERLAGVTVVDGECRRNEVMSILAEVSEDEKNRAFEHWIEICESVVKYGGDDSHTSKELADLVSHYRDSGVRCSTLIGHLR